MKNRRAASCILLICFMLMIGAANMVFAAPANFDIYYNGNIISDGGSVHYQGGSATIGIKVPGANDFYATIAASGISLTYDGGDYNEYSLSNPSGPVTIQVVADGITLQNKIINFYRDTIIDPGASLSYVSVKAKITKVNDQSYYPGIEVDYDGYNNTGVNRNQVAVEFGKIGYKDPGNYMLYGELQVAVFVNGILDGYYWTLSDQAALFTKYTWGPITGELIQRQNWAATEYITPVVQTPPPTPTPTATPTPTPTPTPTATPSPGAKPTLGIDASPKSVIVGQSYSVIDKCGFASPATGIAQWTVTETFKAKGSSTETFVFGPKTITNAGDFFKSYTKNQEGEYTYYISKVVDNKGNTTDGVVSVTVKVDSGATPTPTPPANIPPVAVISAPLQVMAGENANISGRGSYDPDGTIVEYIWEIQGNAIPITDPSGNTYYNTPGTYSIELWVVDNKGATGYAKKYIKVLPPTPTAVIEVTGNKKENRKVTITAIKSWSPERFPIDHAKTTWTIVPISGMAYTSDVKYLGTLNGSKSKDMIFKKTAAYKITLTVTNTAGNSDTTEQIIDIAPDLPPVVNFTVTREALRDYVDSNGKAYGKLMITDMSYSPDGDMIGKRKWLFRYDANNDGNFSDEPFTLISDANKLAEVINVHEVGDYMVDLEVTEDIPFWDTIPELITDADKKKDTSYNW